MRSTADPKGETRREALKKILSVSAGVCIASLGTYGLFFDILASKGISKGHQQVTERTTETKAGNSELLGNEEVNPTGSVTTSMTAIGDKPSPNAPSEYTIKVAYFGFTMTQITGASKEYFTLPAPVFLQDAISQIETRHIVLKPMLPLMSIIVNGTPVSGNPQLENNAEIDLIPAYAGG